MDIRVDHVLKEFSRYPALDDVSLEIKSGELIALLGPSGSGKTTLLRLIAGLERPTAGRIFFGDEDASSKSVQERNVGFVFQAYALFRNMTVLENVSFGLKVRPRSTRPPNAEIKKRAMELLDLVQLTGMHDRFPQQLSGGQRQRVALARALAIEPRVLLLDEPFGALDAQVRKELRKWLREIHDKTGHTTVFVTHDQEEALEVADRVVVMNHGRVEQVGTPDEVYDHPATPFVLQFLGDVNLFHGRLGQSKDGEVSFVRPHELDIVDAAVPGSLAATLVQALTVGPNTRLEFRRGDDQSFVDVEMPRADWLALRDRLGLATGATVHLLPRKLTRFAAEDFDPAAMI